MIKGKTPRMLFIVLLALTNERGRGQYKIIQSSVVGERTCDLFYRFFSIIIFDCIF